FQAEDGIRDFHVTGVQTCALPISDPVGVRVLRGPSDPLTDPPPPSGPRDNGRRRGPTGRASVTTMTRTAWGLDTPTDDWRLHARSEERRVGKEGRAGGRW